MWYALSWLMVIALLAMWSLAAWALHGVPDWMAANAAVLRGAASDAFPITVPDWLAAWIPPAVAQWDSLLLEGLTPFVDSLLRIAPALAGGLTVLIWVIWGLGSALLIALGVGLHLLIAMRRRRDVSNRQKRRTVSARRLGAPLTGATLQARSDHFS